MTKKGYQKRLPVVLAPTARPPSPPAPRRSPETIKAPEPVEAPEAPEPVEQPRRSRSSAVWIAATVLINLVAAGFLVFVITGARTDAPEQSVPARLGAAEPPRILAGRESYVETRVLANGTVAVRQFIRAGEPLDQLSLALPQIPGVEGLAAVRVRVMADGERVEGPRRITGRPVTYTFGRTVDLALSYRLTGAVTRSSSAEGRALAVATTLDLIYSPRVEQETRVVRATEVLTLACSSSPQDPPEPCGEDDGDGQWRVELAGAEVADRVTAAVNIG